MNYFIFTISMILSFASAYFEKNMLSGLILIGSGITLYRLRYKKSGMLLDPAALFSLSWVGGMGVSALKLSALQTVWETETWICFFLAYLFFMFGYEFIERRTGRVKKKESGPERPGQPERLRQLFFCIAAISGISLLSFLTEAAVLGFIPLFTKDTPHAYSYFHLSGIHYLTVSCVLVPPLSVLYVHMLKTRCEALHGAGKESLGPREFLKKSVSVGYLPALSGIFFCVLLSLLIPLLCVSRFQLIHAVLLSVFAAISVHGGIRFDKRLCRAAFLLFLFLLPLYVGLTVARAHDVSYLNGIFEMKNPDTPIFFTQPYMYVANNFDNFNCLVRELPEGRIDLSALLFSPERFNPAAGHTLGLRMLFPLWALSGLKFIVPKLVSFPLYLTKEELTTVTMFYDAYYDFGIAGVAVFAAAVGMLGAFLSAKVREAGDGPAIHLIFVQFVFYMVFSFFTTWFSNPTTWFYFALSVFLYWYLRYADKRRQEGLQNGKGQ